MLDDFDLDAIMDEFDLESMSGFLLSEDKPIRTRHMQPKIIKPEPVIFAHAAELAKATPLKPKMCFYALVSGNFIFGDYLEALVMRGLVIDEMHIATLSLSENNVDSLKNIMLSGRCRKLNLIVSHYFYSHERNNLIPYIYRELDQGNAFQLAVAGSHCKIALIKTAGGHHLTIHGSANLRSSSNIEQIMINEDQRLYDFNRRFLDAVLKNHKTIDKRKAMRGEQLWQQAVESTRAKAD